MDEVVGQDFAPESNTNAAAAPANEKVEQSPIAPSSIPIFADVIEKLESPDFPTREEASRQLSRLASSSESSISIDQLKAVYFGSASPEVSSRVLPVLRNRVLVQHFGPGEGFIGISMSPVVARDRAVPEGVGPFLIQINSVQPDTPAEAAGLRVFDAIVGLNDIDYSHAALRDKFMADVRTFPPSTTIDLKVVRADKLISVPVTLMRRNIDLVYDPQTGTQRNIEDVYIENWLRLESEAWRKENPRS